MPFLRGGTFWATEPTVEPALLVSTPPKWRRQRRIGFFFFSASLLSSVKLRHYRSKMGFEPVEINPVWQEVCK